MGRLVLILLALFAAPALAWFAGRWLLQRNSNPAAGEAARWQDAPWMWLVLAGLFICLVAVFAFGILEPRDCHPVPTQMIDGKLIPAHCE
jgi:hypothetical protein